MMEINSFETIPGSMYKPVIIRKSEVLVQKGLTGCFVLNGFHHAVDVRGDFTVVQRFGTAVEIDEIGAGRVSIFPGSHDFPDNPFDAISTGRVSLLFRYHRRVKE